MHRMGLHLPSASALWDRRTCECNLFERTLNKRNVEETNKFLDILDDESDSYFGYLYDHISKIFLKVPDLLNSKDRTKIIEGIRLLNRVITRSPKDSPVLPAALKIRGDWFFHNFKFQAACSDYEMYLYVDPQTEDPEELCEVNGNLVMCYYLNREYEKTKERLKVYYTYNAELTKDHPQNPDIERIRHHISQFAHELENFDQVLFGLWNDVYYIIPYKGFSDSEYIPHSSVACTYVHSSNNNGGVFANCEIPLGAVLVVEKPLVKNIDNPFVQCDHCLRQKEQVYSCLNCRYKTYCSLSCMQDDEIMHNDECYGYKNLIMLILDANNLYRVFIHVSTVLRDKIFVFQSIRNLNTASAVWEKLQSIKVEPYTSCRQYMSLLTTTPDYFKLSKMQYTTLIVTAFRLTLFIEKHTTILESLYGQLRLSNKQKMIIIGAILMRLNCHLITNMFDFEYLYPLTATERTFPTINEQVKESAGGITPNASDFMETIFSYYDIDFEKEVANRLRRLLPTEMKITDCGQSYSNQSARPCKSIQRQLLTFKDNIAQLYFSPGNDDILYGDASNLPTKNISASFICKQISKLRKNERFTFVKIFARLFHLYFSQYFSQQNQRNNCIQQVASLVCTTLSKFHHSCDPNLEIIVMANGTILAKAIKDIPEGDAICVSFKAHFMRHTIAERKQFLQTLNMACKCKHCQLNEVDDPCNQRLGIFCVCEFTKITPAHGKCVKCRRDYNTLLTCYKTKSMEISKKINALKQQEGTERDLAILYLMLYKHITTCFVPSNEFRIYIELEYAKFLALKNFGEQAFDIIADVKEVLFRWYHDSLIWFTLYDNVLTVIKIIFHYNMNGRRCTVAKDHLKSLCEFGLYILNGQLKHVQLNETYDTECVPIVYDLQMFIQWRYEIPSMEMIPYLAKASQRSNETNEDHRNDDKNNEDNRKDEQTSDDHSNDDDSSDNTIVGSENNCM